MEGEVISRKRFWQKKENPTWLSYSQKCYLSGSLKALGKSYLARQGQYQSACSIARQEIMAEIEKARLEAQLRGSYCPISPAA